MNELMEIIKYIIPSLIVFFTTWWLVTNFLKQERWRLSEKYRQESTSSLLKVRLQAYERLLLFLERISPDQLLLRNTPPDIPASDYQQMLLENIRNEYEHNLIQQLYISAKSWELVDHARMWIIILVNDSAERLDANASANELAIAVIENEMSAKINHINAAIMVIKKEVQELF